jgi:hypothetical protein
VSKLLIKCKSLFKNLKLLKKKLIELNMRTSITHLNIFNYLIMLEGRKGIQAYLYHTVMIRKLHLDTVCFII